MLEKFPKPHNKEVSITPEEDKLQRFERIEQSFIELFNELEENGLTPDNQDGNFSFPSLLAHSIKENYTLGKIQDNITKYYNNRTRYIKIALDKAIQSEQNTLTYGNFVDDQLEFAKKNSLNSNYISQKEEEIKEYRIRLHLEQLDQVNKLCRNQLNEKRLDTVTIQRYESQIDFAHRTLNKYILDEEDPLNQIIQKHYQILECHKK